MVTNEAIENRIRRIADLHDEAIQVDELMDLGEGIRFEDSPSLNSSESDAILEWIKRTDREPLLYALWLTLLSGEPVDSARVLAVQAIQSKETPARSAAALYIEIKFPNHFQSLLDDLITDPDANIAFRASIQKYSNEPSQLVPKIIELFPRLSFDNFDEAVELMRLHGRHENIPGLLSAFGKRALFGDIRDLVDELRNRPR